MKLPKGSPTVFDVFVDEERDIFVVQFEGLFEWLALNRKGAIAMREALDNYINNRPVTEKIH